MITRTGSTATLERSPLQRASSADRRLIALAALTTGALSLLTIILAVTPEARFAVFAPQLDVGLNTVGAVVSIAVAMLSLARYQEHGGLHSLLGASAFLVLAAASGGNLLAIITNEPLGLDWMACDDKYPAHVLRPDDVNALLARLREMKGDRWVALSTFFDVIM